MTEQALPENVQHAIERRIEAIGKATPGPSQFMMQGKAIGYFAALLDTGMIGAVRWAELDKQARAATPMNPPISYDEYWELFPTPLTDLSKGSIGTFNVAAKFGEDSGSLLGLFQAASGVTLSDKQQEMAKSIGLSVAEKGVPNVRQLADAWGEEPDLAEFAAAVKRYMIPS